MVKSRHSSITLYVYMNNAKVGALTKLSSGQLSFQYDPLWLQNELSRPISLSLPLQESAFKGEKVYHFFDNLLPDNESLRNRIQKRFNSHSTQCFDLLSDIGADCVGALALRKTANIEKNAIMSATKLNNKQIAHILTNYQDAPLGMQPESDFRISLAGAQEKTAFLKLKGGWYLPTHTTPTTHIFKLPIGRIKHSGIDLSNSVENEWLCLQLLKAYDLPVNQAIIEEFEDMKVLICERFDRKWSEDQKTIYRLPQEDICQALGLPSSLKYESDGGPGIRNIMDLLNGSLNADLDRKNFFKACFIFWVLGAIDGHAKNFSIFIHQGGRFEMTPLYDVISAYPLATKRQLEWQKLKMAMSVQDSNKHYHWDKILLRHWEQMAVFCKFSKPTTLAIFNHVFDNMNNVIDHVASTLPKNFPLVIADSIFNGMKKIRNKALTKN